MRQHDMKGVQQTKRCDMKTVQTKKCNMKRAQYEKSLT